MYLFSLCVSYQGHDFDDCHVTSFFPSIMPTPYQDPSSPPCGITRLSCLRCHTVLNVTRLASMVLHCYAKARMRTGIDVSSEMKLHDCCLP